MIIELNSVEELKYLLSSLNRDKYKMLLTENGEIFVRPTVSTKPLDTLYIKNLQEGEVNAVELWFGKEKSFRVKQIFIDEEKDFRFKKGEK